MSPIQYPKSKIQNEAGQASILSLLAAVVIIGLLMWLFLFRHPNKHSEKEELAHGAFIQSDKKTIPGAAMDQAKGVDCANNLGQLRMAIGMARSDNDGVPPASLQSIHGMGSAVMKCPATGQPYVYDPRTGQVHCTTPGHERL